MFQFLRNKKELGRKMPYETIQSSEICSSGNSSICIDYYRLITRQTTILQRKLIKRLKGIQSTNIKIYWSVPIPYIICV